MCRKMQQLLEILNIIPYEIVFSVNINAEAGFLF